MQTWEQVLKAEDRRVAGRRMFEEVVQLKWAGRVYRAVTCDLGRGGLGLAGDIPVPLGEVFRLYLPLRRPTRKGSRFCAVPARLVWREAARVGIEFVDASDDVKAQVAAFLQRA